MFQHTAARRRLAECAVLVFAFACVSTHSRPKAAGNSLGNLSHRVLVSTHSRPKAAGNKVGHFSVSSSVSTHSRPKAAGRFHRPNKFFNPRFNTQPPEGGWEHSGKFKTIFSVSTHSRPKAAGKAVINSARITLFQHTAARRRLAG